MKLPHVFLRGIPPLVSIALLTATAQGQDDDLEIESAPAADPTPPSAAAAPAADAAAPVSTPAASAPQSEATPSAANTQAEPAAKPATPARASAAPNPAEAAYTQQSASEPVSAAPNAESLPGARSPVGQTSLPRTLIAEGSNYTRPLRRGLSWWGFVQADYYINQQSEDQLDPDGEPLNEDSIGIRRARLRVDHGWEYAFATLEIDAGTFNDGPNIQLRRAEASVLYRGSAPDDVTPLVVLTAGVTDVPFGAEIGESQRDRLFADRSLGSLALFPSLQDGGIKIWGAYGFFNYAFAVVNGESTGGLGVPKDHNAYKDFVGRVGVATRLAEVATLTGGLSFYTGKGFSPGTVAGKDTVTWIDLNNNGTTDSGEIQGVTGSAAVPSRNFDRWAIGLDAGGSLRDPLGVLQVAVEAFYASNLDRGVQPWNPVVSGSNARQLGLTAYAVQQITKWGALGFRVAYYDPNSNLIEQRASEFHLQDQTYWVFSPVAALTLPHGRIAAQYDIVTDHLGRDGRGVPANIRNNQLTLRLQVDL